MSIKNAHALIAVIKLQQQQYDKRYHCSVIINCININNLNKKYLCSIFFIFEYCLSNLNGQLMLLIV